MTSSRLPWTSSEDLKNTRIEIEWEIEHDTAILAFDPTADHFPHKSTQDYSLTGLLPGIPALSAGVKGSAVSK